MSKTHIDLAAAIFSWVVTFTSLITSVFGAIGAVASAIWLCYRTYDYIKQRKVPK